MKVSHPEKVLFPDCGVTKGDLVEYYELIGEVMLPHVYDRPLTMERYPDGIDGKGFIQKSAPAYFPKFVERARLGKKGGTVDYVVCRKAQTLPYLANQNCITPHVWTSRASDASRPDELIVDLDPPTADVDLVRRAALLTRSLLDELGVGSLVKTSGSRGLHVVVPLQPESEFEDVSAFATALARALVARDPSRLTTEDAKAARGGRLFVDVGRNNWGAMTAAPYAVRARPGATVSTPIEWDELGELDPSRFTLRTIPSRLEGQGDPWSGLVPARLPPAVERLRELTPAATPPEPARKRAAAPSRRTSAPGT
jgi:bifunctional non-homologous end joining protein LigD